MCEIDNYKQAEVTYKFYIPDNNSELKSIQNARKYENALEDIYHRCRDVWKYKEFATDEEIDLAERISEIVYETGVFDE